MRRFIECILMPIMLAARQQDYFWRELLLAGRDVEMLIFAAFCMLSPSPRHFILMISLPFTFSLAELYRNKEATISAFLR